MRAASFTAQPAAQARRCVAARAKPDIHPKLVTSKVVCNGETVYEVTGTQPTYTVDLWSGNHPYYLGVTSTLVLDEGQVNKFKSRYSGLGFMANVQTANSAAKDRVKADAAAAAAAPAPPAPAKADKKKKK